MKEYILVINYVRNKPVALVRSEFGRAKVIAGDKSAERVFIDGDPHNIDRRYGFTLLGHSSCHPDIGNYIDLLGPVLDKEEKWKRAEKRAAKAIATLAKLKTLPAGADKKAVLVRTKAIAQAFHVVAHEPASMAVLHDLRNSAVDLVWGYDRKSTVESRPRVSHTACEPPGWFSANLRRSYSRPLRVHVSPFGSFLASSPLIFGAIHMTESPGPRANGSHLGDRRPPAGFHFGRKLCTRPGLGSTQLMRIASLLRFAATGDDSNEPSGTSPFYEYMNTYRLHANPICFRHRLTVNISAPLAALYTGLPRLAGAAGACFWAS